MSFAVYTGNQRMDFQRRGVGGVFMWWILLTREVESYFSHVKGSGLLDME